MNLISMKPNYLSQLLILFLFLGLFVRGYTASSFEKPRVVVLADIGVQDMDDQKDRDDIQSLVRLLLYANELDLEGLIATKSRKNAVSMSNQKNNIIDVFPATMHNIINAYAEVYPNLILHDPRYPAAAHLHSIVKAGNPNQDIRWGGGDDMLGVGAGKATEASQLIVDVLQKDDPRPVWFLVWGKAIDLAQALWDLRQELPPEKLDQVTAKVRVYDVAGQDNTGSWIAHTFPDIFYLRVLSQFKGFGDTPLLGDESIITDEWADEHVRSHGELGKKYIVNHRTRSGGFHFEGDSPSFMYLIPNGLSNPEQPYYGSWGGRFSKLEQKNVTGLWAADHEKKYHDFWMFAQTGDTWKYRDTTYKDNIYAPIARWRQDYQNDFAARMDWCISPYEQANHAPRVVVNGDTTLSVLQVYHKPRSTIRLDAAGSADPDGNDLSYRWWVYPEPGSYQKPITLSENQDRSLSFQLPEDALGKTVHIILEVKDNGSPSLKSYRRIVVRGSHQISRQPWVDHGALRVSDSSRYLEHEDGTPFFWLGDTGWQLFKELSREEADAYLENRGQKRFNVVMGVLLAEYDNQVEEDPPAGLGPNYYGHKPMNRDNPAQPLVVPGGSPNQPNDFWDHADYIIDQAAKKGLYVGLLPCWGWNYVNGSGSRGNLKIFDEASAKEYGMFLGKRYRDSPNIIWIIGGDDDPMLDSDYRPIYRAMAEGIAQGVTGESPAWNEKHSAWDKVLMTFHPRGNRRSSEFFHEDAWLDFNFMQTGHRTKDNPTSYQYILTDRSLEPIKPTLDGEPRYEDHPAWRSGWYTDSTRYRDFDIRQSAYWSVLAGACGYTYGHHSIWRFFDADDIPVAFQDRYWPEALDRPGAYDMTHLRNLMESVPWHAMVPATSIIISDNPDDSTHLQAIRGENHLLVYNPCGVTFEMQMGKVAGEKVETSWFDPRTGRTKEIGVFANKGKRTFDAPEAPRRGNDWVLIVEAIQENNKR